MTEKLAQRYLEIYDYLSLSHNVTYCNNQKQATKIFEIVIGFLISNNALCKLSCRHCYHMEHKHRHARTYFVIYITLSSELDRTL